MPTKRQARTIKRSQESEAEAKLQAHGYKTVDDLPKRVKGVPDGYRRFTCVLNVADNQLLHDWAQTAHGETFTSVLSVAISEYIENHIVKAAEAGLKVRRPSHDSEEFQDALAKYADLYQDENTTSPYDKFL